MTVFPVLEEDEGMRIEVLHITDCPSWIEAGHRLHNALGALGYADANVTHRLIDSAHQAAQVSFAGSPTITVDGIDLLPDAQRTANLACRIYSASEGFAGTPTTEQIREALRPHVQ